MDIQKTDNAYFVDLASAAKAGTRARLSVQRLCVTKYGAHGFRWGCRRTNGGGEGMWICGVQDLGTAQFSLPRGRLGIKKLVGMHMEVVASIEEPGEAPRRIPLTPDEYKLFGISQKEVKKALDAIEQLVWSDYLDSDADETD